MNSCVKSVSTFHRHAVIALFGALTFGFVVVSLADDSHDVRKVTVKFADLNVSTPQGAAALYSRIRTAAGTVCSPNDYAWFQSRPGVKACMQKAIAEAVVKVNQPALYAVYNEQNKTPLPTTLLSQSR